ALPISDLQVIGVTGTSGKTTTTFLLESALAAAGATTGLVGTIETRSAGRTVAGVRTTPEATDLQRLLAQMRRDGVTHVAMEVSKIGRALEIGRASCRERAEMAVHAAARLKQRHARTASGE